MSINIPSKPNYSFLFQNLGTAGGGAANLNFLSDYASIKNGSYGKLMKAYYGTGRNSEISALAERKKTSSEASDSTKDLAAIQRATDKLKESADALLETGKKSVFDEKEVTEEAYKAVSAFVDDYNAVLSASDNINSTSILNKTLSLATATQSNKNLLEKVGITIDEDNNLKLDKEAFMKADLATVKSLFQGAGSYAYRVSAQSSLINFAADNEASKAATYTSSGAYGNAYHSGDMFNSFF